MPYHLILKVISYAFPPLPNKKQTFLLIIIILGVGDLCAFRFRGVNLSLNKDVETPKCSLNAFANLSICFDNLPVPALRIMYIPISVRRIPI